MKRIDEFEASPDALLEEFNDVECEEIADSLEYYANDYRRKAR